MPWVHQVGRRLLATAGPDAVSLSTSVELVGQDQRTTAEFDVVSQSVPPG